MRRAINYFFALLCFLAFAGQSFSAETENTREEKLADRAIEFANSAQAAFGNGYFHAPEKLATEVRRYRDSWRVRKVASPTGRAGALARLKPPKGVFSPEEEKDLTRALDGMDKALTDMLAGFRELEKYVADHTVIDDGKKGLDLCAKMDAAYDKFHKARDAWLGVVEKRAAAAEELSLSGHPLRRQIACAQKIFAQTRLAAELCGKEALDRKALVAVAGETRNLAAEGGKPPFPARPSLERRYREFLNGVNAWLKTLDEIILEGADGGRRAALARAQKNCGDAYNLFVREVNGEPGPGRKGG